MLLQIHLARILQPSHKLQKRKQSIILFRKVGIQIILESISNTSMQHFIVIKQ